MCPAKIFLRCRKSSCTVRVATLEVDRVAVRLRLGRWGPGHGTAPADIVADDDAGPRVGLAHLDAARARPLGGLAWLALAHPRPDVAPHVGVVWAAVGPTAWRPGCPAGLTGGSGSPPPRAGLTGRASLPGQRSECVGRAGRVRGSSEKEHTSRKPEDAELAKAMEGGKQEQAAQGAVAATAAAAG